MRGTVNNMSEPDMFPTSVPPTPDYILRMIKCSCENCGSARCSCLSYAPLFIVMHVLTVVNASVQVPDSDDEKESD